MVRSPVRGSSHNAPTGTSVAERVSPYRTSTCTNIPGRRAPLPLGTSISPTVLKLPAARNGGTRVSVASITESPIAREDRRTGSPTASRESIASVSGTSTISRSRFPRTNSSVSASTRAPGSTIRRPTCPSIGERRRLRSLAARRSSRVARACSTRAPSCAADASAAVNCASRVSSSRSLISDSSARERVRTTCARSSARRASASRVEAWASRRDASACATCSRGISPRRRTSGWPFRTASPLRTRTASTIPAISGRNSTWSAARAIPERRSTRGSAPVWAFTASIAGGGPEALEEIPLSRAQPAASSEAPAMQIDAAIRFTRRPSEEHRKPNKRPPLGPRTAAAEPRKTARGAPTGGKIPPVSSSAAGGKRGPRRRWALSRGATNEVHADVGRPAE